MRGPGQASVEGLGHGSGSDGVLEAQKSPRSSGDRVEQLQWTWGWWDCRRPCSYRRAGEDKGMKDPAKSPLKSWSVIGVYGKQPQQVYRGWSLGSMCSTKLSSLVQGLE